MAQVKVYLPEDPEERAKVLNNLIEKHKTVTLIKDEEQKLVAEISEEKQYEIHPVTGLPVLLD